MSHFTDIKTEIKDLNALRDALSAMNLKLEHNKPCRFYYGAPCKENVTKLPGPYDVSFVKNSDGAYSINADFYGGHVAKTIGEEGSLLIKNYSIAKIRLEAEKLRCKVFKTEKGLRILDSTSSGRIDVSFDENGIAKFEASGFKGRGCMKFEKLEKALGAVKSTRKTSAYYEAEVQKTRIKESL